MFEIKNVLRSVGWSLELQPEQRSFVGLVVLASLALKLEYHFWVQHRMD